MPISFPTDLLSIKQRLENIKPTAYCRNRNFIDGDVTYLSPYISRGVISTRQVYLMLQQQGYDLKKIQKFVQELAWRDYWQNIWIACQSSIDEDLKRPQPEVTNQEMSQAILMGQTGIDAIDEAIRLFYKTGYIHNHMRMYIAALACNVAGSHWWIPAQWMYYHLLDADWASNALSWQWVAGSNSHKKYYANQENINKYCESNQAGTYLDCSYAELPKADIPEVLSELVKPEFKTALPDSRITHIDSNKKTLIYNFYNLDPNWHLEEDVNRVLLLEPSLFARYPVSPKSIDFVIQLAENIPNVQLCCMPFDDLVQQYKLNRIVFKEHPLNSHYRGEEEPRDWMFDVHGYFSSFFKFWNACQKTQIKQAS
ncbi:FAD-binding domain-containing protein [Marinicella sp. W31]|uniref:FAD-binding domain-containing protein n=1 Tax=Marinicella sp. W31 TaxID=3023713 RepID=UPI00375783DF